MKTPHRSHCTLVINGVVHRIDGAQCFEMLADFLRYTRALTGTKIVCAEGDCGACTVLMARTSEQFFPINACILPVMLLDGCHIVTVEGLAQNGSLSPVQKALVDHHSSQCGFCTPGFVMAMTAMFETPCKPASEQRVKNCLTGNLCRCTGYQSIIDAALAIDPNDVQPLSQRFITNQSKTIFAEEKNQSVLIINEEYEFYAPSTLEDALRYRSKKPQARIVSGATDLGVLINKGRIAPNAFLSLHLLKELAEIRFDQNRVIVGATVTLRELRNALKQPVPLFADFLNIFASPQIKNVATLAGNVANGSPIADTIPFLMVADGLVHVTNENQQRSIPITDFYRGYKTLALDASEIITHISFVIPSAKMQLRLEKVSQRKDLDISTVNCAFLLQLDASRRISDARIAVGGVSSTVLRMPKVETSLLGRELHEDTINDASTIFMQDIAPISDVRGTADYRRDLVDGLFRRFCRGVFDHAS